MKNKIDKYLEDAQGRYKLHDVLLANIKKNLPELEKLLIEISGHWEYEDCIYRYYHHSFKVYYIQNHTKAIFDALLKLRPHKEDLNSFFMDIYKDGCSMIEWNQEHNKKWGKICRPLVEAFLHSKYFLEMIVKYGKELEETPTCLPSGWASVLHLYNLR
jgi:hypothetical protein